ncbi:uncharacterized protein TRUGW13939_03766 [Talaromyces rugulosus]|uniref:Uncharacterized protein n=1 Tax=Talaromyces rugulosus TaxID=121627 RepID=A0A7H8QRQ5_TALRU|nr:uncharacterized protein TRUGW13939_03766 [Talaromyces rugulosus]QKX56660.1 hypothetical protein TRUGW13939_03766 [Talaromyces rugulosus]
MDLSSLEGPPTLDDRFTFTISSPSPVSPVGGGATWERSRRQPSIPQPIPPTPISPLSESPRSFSPSGSLPSTLRRPNGGGSNGSDGGYSNYYNYNNYYNNNNNNNSNSNYYNDRYESPAPPRLRSSRSFSTLQEPASIPPRPASAGNHSSPSPSPRLITNGRLVWLEEQQIWILIDSPSPAQQGAARALPRARNPDTVHVVQHSSNPLIQYYDPVSHQDEILQDGAAMPPPSYESHRFSLGRLHPQRITIPAPPHHHNHRSDRPPRTRTQWASVADRLGRSPLA